MYKKRKKELNMVDMKARLHMKIIPGTPEESNILQKELDEINIAVEKRMQLYEKNLKDNIHSIMSGNVIVSNDEVEYFINTYQSMIENRNIDNIKNRLAEYNAYISESQSNF